jgi:hypothetical protein
VKTILFPTDFTEHSKTNFRQVLNLAKTFHASVTLFHAIARPVEGLFNRSEPQPKVYNYRGQMLPLEQIIKNQVELQSEQAERWKKLAGLL